MVDIGILDIGKKLILEIPTFYEFHIFVFFFFQLLFFTVCLITYSCARPQSDRDHKASALLPNQVEAAALTPSLGDASSRRTLGLPSGKFPRMTALLHKASATHPCPWRRFQISFLKKHRYSVDNLICLLNYGEMHIVILYL